MPSVGVYVRGGPLDSTPRLSRPTATVYRWLLAWTRNFGILARAGVEGARSCRAALTRFLRRHHIAVIEVNRPTAPPAAAAT
ncbi:hypothetical protein OHA72_56410 [Dactylosporangium sp. NBC_01737]|uniref:hypothetical protein n=1 Tax=Dactylosporangium sp. NBC_01737 TaxID=2975959 RepID=UPI002E162468|nr:hypothetical protein OHA72_56410 [Dactylosporangium sp. NBC_01737]